MRIVPVVPVTWFPWGEEAFARARAEDKPVLLSITAAWSSACAEMDRTSYADPEIAALINDRFIAVRVDADRRPDISERYSLGGWPTTAFLTSEGDIVGGGTFVTADRMRGVLTQLAQAFSGDGDRIARRAAEARAHADTAGLGLTAPVDGREAINLEDLCDRVFAEFDSRHGGFGDAPKFPHVAPVHLALTLNIADADSRLQTIAIRTLDAMGWSALYDEVDGGFFRCAAAPDWEAPQREKLLEVNAALLRLYLDAGALLSLARFTERAADVLRYVQGWLADPLDGGWHGSQRADDDYYTVMSAEQRRTILAPPTDTALYCDSNATMVSAALRAAAVFEDTALQEFALKSLERVGLACYRPGCGVAHYLDGASHVRGLLADQIKMAAAHLDAFDATGNIVYEMMAEELAHYAVRVMWDTDAGGFFDCILEDGEPIGLMRHRLKPFVTNCEAACMLRRLSSSSGDSEFGRLADATLASVAPQAAAHGPLAAHYVLAARELAVR